MSKQAKPPPPGDKPAPSAPPPPPTWRNWLWPIMLVVIFALFFLLPTRSPSTSLTYSQFLSDVSAHQVKTVQLASTPGGTSTGTLTNGKNFTVVVPPQAGQELLTELQDNNVQVSSAPSGNGFGTEVLIYLITFGLPILIFVWLFRRISRGAAGGLQGALGVGRSRAKVFDEERPNTKFADVAGVRGRQGRDRRGGGLPRAARSGTPGSARWCPAACSWSGRPAPARRCWPARSRARRRCRSSRSPGPASSSCSSASARPGSVTCSSRRASARPPSSSSTRSTRSASAGPARARWSPTTSGSRR